VTLNSRPRNRNRAVLLAAVAALTLPAEGLRQKAYRDPVGVLTVCYGSTGSHIDPNRTYSIDECRNLHDTAANSAIDTVERCHPGLPDSVLVAFADTVYNVGPSVACSSTPSVACSSTASRLLSQGNYSAACEQLLRWDKAKVLGTYIALPGLTKRRQAARTVCLKDLPNALSYLRPLYRPGARQPALQVSL